MDHQKYHRNLDSLQVHHLAEILQLTDFKVYYHEGKTGWTNPWYGYPTVEINGSNQCHSADINFDSGLNTNMSDILFLPLLQVLAFERSLAKGLNPDRPNNLEAVVVLDY